jgi:hypothetical protein
MKEFNEVGMRFRKNYKVKGWKFANRKEVN